MIWWYVAPISKSATPHRLNWKFFVLVRIATHESRKQEPLSGYTFCSNNVMCKIEKLWCQRIETPRFTEKFKKLLWIDDDEYSQIIENHQHEMKFRTFFGVPHTPTIILKFSPCSTNSNKSIWEQRGNSRNANVLIYWFNLIDTEIEISKWWHTYIKSIGLHLYKLADLIKP